MEQKPTQIPKVEGRQTARMAHIITRRITLNLVTGIVLTFITVVGAIFWMAASQNQQAEDGATTMIEGGVDAQRENTKAIVNDYGWWQDFYDAYQQGDDAWIQENIGDSITATLIADTSAILSPEGDLKYSWIYEDYDIPTENIYTPKTNQGIVQLMKDAPLESLAGRVSYVLADGQVILIGVARIVPHQHVEEVTDKNTLPYTVWGFILTDDFLHNLGSSFLIDDLHLVTGSDVTKKEYASFPAITDINGDLIGRFVWTPPNPGYKVLRSVAPPIAVALLIFIIIVVSTAYRTRRIAVALSKASQDLQESEQEIARQLTIVASEKERIEAIVSSVGEGLLVVDPDGKIFLSNKAASFILGKDEPELLGTTLNKIFNVKVKKESPFAPILDALRSKQTIRVEEATFNRADGEMVILALTATPVELDGKPIGEIVVFHDVTEQKLIAAAKDQFITTAAHQLRTPLSGIRWAMSLILDGSVGEVQDEQKELIKKSYESVNRLNLLINDLLNIDKLEKEQTSLKLAPTDMKELLDEILTDLQEQVKRKKIDVEFTTEKDLPQLELDRGSIQVVFQNLIENAIRYTKEGGTVTVNAVKEDGNVHVTIADTGIGIPRNQQKSIFTRFFRAGNAQLLEPDGSGLGLYITKQIVDRHHGELWFESEEGKGTTFHVILLAKNDKKSDKKA